MAKIGFCCKYVAEHSAKLFESVDYLNTGSTTVAWLHRQNKAAAEQKLWDLMVKNLTATQKIVETVGDFASNLRMLRIGSDLLPMYTHPEFKYFWKQPSVIDYIITQFGEIGRIARSRDVRLSFHPGPFTCLASENPDIVDRSIEEFEYHVDMARAMGYGKSFQDFKINVHISGRLGPDGIRQAYKRLSKEAQNTITIENDEHSHDLDTCLKISDLCPIVLDVHHHWVNSGEYIQPNDERIKRIIDSWRGITPVMHYSVSREDVLIDHPLDVLPDMKKLLSLGYTKQKLRAHSDFFWNSAVNDWVKQFITDFDIQCESKAKNLSSIAFAKTVFS